MTTPSTNRNHKYDTFSIARINGQEDHNMSLFVSGSDGNLYIDPYNYNTLVLFTKQTMLLITMMV